MIYLDDAAVAVGQEFAVFDVFAKTLTIHIDAGMSTANHVLAAVTMVSGL